jgi:2-polyprenyl-3-methyl-5-hydroxy-6-metoxy-1,4-benzoquinol methylase
MLRRAAKAAWDRTAALLSHLKPRHVIGRLSGKYYFEDYVRVYPDGARRDRSGKAVPASDHDRRNFLNHQKFYRFAAQFVKGRSVADVGCGSGHGCALLKAAGAAEVCGADVSSAAIDFARSSFPADAQFTLQGITDLSLYATGRFDVTLTSEVLEHIKEYGKEDLAMSELRRVTRPGGIVIVATPNSEMLKHHGFSFDEMSRMMDRHFGEHVIFENALVPSGDSRGSWEARLAAGRVGVIVSEAIRLDETVLRAGHVPEVKKGEAPGVRVLGPISIDTSLLHNTHSWVAIGINGSVSPSSRPG